MKREYVTPTATGEIFAANEYVSACSDPGTTTYKFTCNAHKNWNFLIDRGSVYLETNGRSGLQTSSDEYLGEYHQCGKTHTVTVPKGTSVDDIFQDGYFKPAGILDTSVRQVKVWTDGGTNIHCSANLSASDYVPVRS